MACYWLNQGSTTVQIPVSEEVNGVTYYRIIMSIGKVQWSILHRYREFYELHQKLVTDHGLSRDLIPPKRLLRNKCPFFIEKRRHALEEYLRYILMYLKQAMPREFQEFLHFQYYDIFYMLQELASHFYLEAENILSSSNSYVFNTIQLHAISECFKRPCPHIHNVDKTTDLCHVLDFCSKLNKLTLRGESSNHMLSNIVPNNLHIEFTSFKVLKVLEIRGINFEMVQSAVNLRSTLTVLRVHKTLITNISQVLQCDILHKDSLENKLVWKSLKLLDLSSNSLEAIDETIQLLPSLETLILNNNKIREIGNLFTLSNLKHLHVANNKIASCEDMHTKIGNISTLDLSQNLLRNLKGLSKLYSLEHLNISSNNILEVQHIACLGDLPCIENLSLTGNPVSTTIDYRVKVLEYFGEKYSELCLDNEKPTQQEIDKVSVLRALRIVREGRKPSFNN